MYCSNCGSKVNQDSNFCSKCGTRILKLDSKNIKEVKELNANSSQNEELKKIQKKPRIGILIIIGILSISLIVLGISYMLAQRSQIDVNFLENFPFQGGTLNDAESWLKASGNYTCKRTVDSLEGISKKNIGWSYEIFDETYGIDGNFVILDKTDPFYKISFAKCKSELENLCGSPIYSSPDSGAAHYYYKGLKIMLLFGNDDDLHYAIHIGYQITD